MVMVVICQSVVSELVKIGRCRHRSVLRQKVRPPDSDYIKRTNFFHYFASTLPWRHLRSFTYMRTNTWLGPRTKNWFWIPVKNGKKFKAPKSSSQHTFNTIRCFGLIRQSNSGQMNYFFQLCQSTHLWSFLRTDHKPGLNTFINVAPHFRHENPWGIDHIKQELTEEINTELRN